eukprot:13381384-Alexandrium_andersonii.AAC.1
MTHRRYSLLSYRASLRVAQGKGAHSHSSTFNVDPLAFVHAGAMGGRAGMRAQADSMHGQAC